MMDGFFFAFFVIVLSVAIMAGVIIGHGKMDVRSCFDVEGVADAIAKEHERQYEEHDGRAGQEGKVGTVEQDVAVVLFDHGAPRGHGGLHTDAEEAEAGFE